MKGLDTQGWQIQLATTVWPKVKKKKVIKNWYQRLAHNLDKKSNAIEAVYEDPVRFEKYPKRRLKHLIRQMDRFEDYLGTAQVGGEHGGLVQYADGLRN